MKTNFLVVLTVAFLSACLSQTIKPDPNSEQVKFFENPKYYTQCQFMEEMKSIGLAGSQNSYEQALIKIKNQAIQAGGNYIHLKQIKTDNLTTAMQGDLYLCPNEFIPEAKDIVQ